MMAAFSHTLPVRNSNKREGGKYYVHDIFTPPLQIAILIGDRVKI